MKQLYLQRFQYRGAVDKSAFDAAWATAHEAMARTGNWGNVQAGVTHLHGYGTASGGYAVLEVSDPTAFDQYQMFHTNNYSHLVTVTFEPLVDLDAALAPLLDEIRSKSE